MSSKNKFLCFAFVIFSMFSSIGLTKEANTEYGELKIEDKHIISLILVRDDGNVEDLGKPEGVVQLPIGKYFVKNLVVSDQDQYSIGTKTKPISQDKWITISKDKPALLIAGTPLKQIIEVEKKGRYLVFNYKLIGIDGEKYGKTTNTSNPPEFQIYKGDKLITSDKFRYG